MSKFSRRDFVKITGGTTAALAGGALSVPVIKSSRKGTRLDPSLLEPDKLDYTKAKAVPTICFGCTTHCGVVGWVQDGRVRRIEGNPLDPNSRGKICGKANGMIHYTYYPERLIYPLKRVGARGEGKWKRISYEEAIEEIAERMRPLRESGHPERFVFQYGRDKTKGYTRRFTDAFGTPNRLNRRSICSSNRRAPLMSFYGRDFEWESQDFAETQYIINFGGNPMEAYQGGMYIMQRIQEARVDRGARMVTFEVRPSATASVSDEYYPIMPGTDGVVALAMANVLIDEGFVDREFWRRWVNVSLEEVAAHIREWTPERAARESGVPAEAIIRIAREFGRAAPRATTLSNRGSAKHYNGFQADRGIRLLDVLVGSVGKPGGFCLSSGRGWRTGRYGQEGLPDLNQPEPRPPKPEPFLPGTPQFEELPEEVKRRVEGFPPEWQQSYFGELATPSEYPLSWNWYPMRVGQLVYPYLAEGRARAEVYMSYTLGAAYGFPEAKVAREILADEEIIPFHVAVDIGMGEQTALADIVLPEATSLERWDFHSTNSYDLRPYTGIRQPLVDPPGEARSIQVILRDLAHRIGGGMEAYFDFDDVEEFYRDWYSNLPVSFEELKRRGIWYDPDRPKDYELYEREVPAEELARTKPDPETGILYTDSGKAVGILKDGKAVRGFPTPSRKIQVYDDVFPKAARHVGIPEDDPLASPLPTYFPVPSHEDLPEDRLVFTTFKWNVHTQGRSGHLKYQAEIVHTNPLLLHPETGHRLGLEDGCEVEVTVFRPRGAHAYRAGEEEPVGTFRNRVRFMEGVHPRVAASAHSVGHWEHGAVGRGQRHLSKVSAAGRDDSRVLFEDSDIPEHVWWLESRGGPGSGVHINDPMPINPSPLVGGQNWFDNVCQVRRV